MTALPQLVAAFHSLVGLGSLLPQVLLIHQRAGIVNENGDIFKSSLVEMSLGVAIGAIITDQ